MVEYQKYSDEKAGKKARRSERRTFRYLPSHIVTRVPTRASKNHAHTQCLPCGSSIALQGGHLWEIPKPTTTDNNGRRRRIVRSRKNRQMETRKEPVILRSQVARLQLPGKHHGTSREDSGTRPSHEGVLTKKPLGARPKHV